MKMKNNQEKPAIILANVEVFDYLKEKVGERKTRTEAYCDLLDKSLAGFVSPFLRKHDYELRPCQCHVTVSDLAAEWHWHRATVRSFLETMETFGQLKRIKLTKSVVITMPVQSGQSEEPHNVQEPSDFAMQLREALSDWVIGKATSAEVGRTCGQLVRQAMTGAGVQDSHPYSDVHVNMSMASENDDKQAVKIRATALECIALAAMRRVLRKSRFGDSLELMDFFRLELGGEWAAFIEVSKELAGLILDAGANETAIDMDEDKELLKSLRNPFLSLLAKAQEAAD